MKIGNIVLALAASLVLAACATLQEYIDGGGGTAELTVTFATLKYIEDAGNEARQVERAVRVAAVAEEVREVAKGEEVTIAALEAFVMGKLPEDLSPADRYLATNLVGVLVMQLQDRVDGDVLDPDELLAVDQLLGWVVNATAFFVPVEPIGA